MSKSVTSTPVASETALAAKPGTDAAEQDRRKTEFIDRHFYKIASPECDALLAAMSVSVWSAARPGLGVADVLAIRAKDDAKVSARESWLGNAVAGGSLLAAFGLLHVAFPPVGIGLMLYQIFGFVAWLDRGGRAVVFHTQNKALRDRIGENLRDIAARNEPITPEKALKGARAVKLGTLAADNAFVLPLSWAVRKTASVLHAARASATGLHK